MDRYDSRPIVSLFSKRQKTKHKMLKKNCSERKNTIRKYVVHNALLTTRFPQNTVVSNLNHFSDSNLVEMLTTLFSRTDQTAELVIASLTLGVVLSKNPLNGYTGSMFVSNNHDAFTSTTSYKHSGIFYSSEKLGSPNEYRKSGVFWGLRKLTKRF